MRRLVDITSFKANRSADLNVRIAVYRSGRRGPDMASKFIDTNFFKSALGYAKAVARARDEANLTQLAMLAGLLQAAIVADEGDDAQMVANNGDAIQAALHAHNVALPGDDTDLVEEKMPLSEDLKNALNTHSKDMEAFLGMLLNNVAPVSLTSNPLAVVIAPYLLDYLREGEDGIVCNDAFAAAAFSAFESGEFKDYVGLSSFFSANRLYFVALIEKVFEGRQATRQELTTLPKLSAELVDALRDQEDGAGARFVAAVDLGLTTGVNIISDRATAYHEAGHAVVSSVLRPEVPINKIKVKREQDYDGVTIYDGSSPHFRRWRREDDQIELCVLLAGQAAQSLKFGLGYMDRGVSSDIERATKRAWASIAYYGLDLEFGPVDLSIFEQKTGWLFDEAQKRLQAVMKDAAARTDNILRENWIKLEAIATALIATGEVDFEQFVGGLTLNGLGHVPGALKAENLKVIRRVTFAKQAGSHQTPEGAVRYEAGDALVTGEDNDSWPIARAKFDELYCPNGGTQAGADGLYEKKTRRVWALSLGENSRVDMPGGRGVLLGRSGDWIVDYGGGDMAIVAGATFAKLYQITY